jgi:hypothetical protein
MNAREFLEILLPDTGFIFTATPGPTTGWINVSHKGLESAIQHVNTLTFDNRAAYFALATYEKEKVWDAGKNQWRRRTQDNAQFIKSFFLDLDVDPENPNKFASKQDAITRLQALTRKLGLPRPMLIDSGGGVHVYWPLALAVPTTLWRPVADQLKAICTAEGFPADPAPTSDQARVLRCIGGYNVRRGAPVKLLVEATAPISFTDFAQRLQAFTPAVPLTGPPTSVWADSDGNIGATNDPLHFDRIVFSCQQLQLQVAKHGAGVGEQLWRAGLGIVKFCADVGRAAFAISGGHADYSEARTRAKLENWHTPPTACSHFDNLNPSGCDGCPHHGHITSPAQLGRQIIAAPAPIQTVVVNDDEVIMIALPDPPFGYKRRSDGAVVQESEDVHGNVVHDVICPYDLYPLAIRTQSGVDAAIDEHSTWRAHLPLERGQPLQVRDFDVPLGLLSDSRGLSKLLFSKGLILNGDQAKGTHHYMSAYLQKLAKEAGRDKLYERLGWHDEHTAFVMADRVMFRDGTTAPHTPNAAIKTATKNGLKTGGTLEGWKRAMQFYDRPGYEGHRFFMYAALGSPLFHMNDTGNRGVTLTATGKSGRGKTTCLKACGSLWGEPEALLVNGNRDGSTVNALYSTLGTYHSLPMLLDDITERDADQMRQLFLNIPQGQGKRRLTADASQSAKLDFWECMVLTTSNIDELTRMLSSGMDVSAHAMRVISVEFASIDTGTEAKIQADRFLREIGQHYGHVGPAMMSVVTQRYITIKKGFIANVAMIDRLLASSNASAERIWSAAIAAAYTAAQIAKKMGLIDFPIESDLLWMIDHLVKQRAVIAESGTTPLETITDFLNAYMRNTLTISARNSSNLDNVARAHVDALLIRHDLDLGVIYVARTAIMDYCATARISFRTLEYELEAIGVLVNRNAQKTLGADTIYRTGQTRCWLLNAAKLGDFVAAPVPAAAGHNVVHINSGVRTA